MARIVRGGLIQASIIGSGTDPIDHIKKNMMEKHLALIEKAARRGVQVLCLQELFYGPYFVLNRKPAGMTWWKEFPKGPRFS